MSVLLCFPRPSTEPSSSLLSRRVKKLFKRQPNPSPSSPNSGPFLWLLFLLLLLISIWDNSRTWLWRKRSLLQAWIDLFALWLFMLLSLVLELCLEFFVRRIKFSFCCCCFYVFVLFTRQQLSIITSNHKTNIENKHTKTRTFESQLGLKYIRERKKTNSQVVSEY